MNKEKKTDKRDLTLLSEGYRGTGIPPKTLPNIQSGVMKPNQGNTNMQKSDTTQKK